MRETDPATFEVVKNALYCAAEEMKVVLAKTAYSPLLKVAGDYSCGLFDVRGEMVAQGPDLPIHLGSMPLAVKAVIQASPSFEPGDVFIHNDPYFGGSHLPDVNVVTPAFHEGSGRIQNASPTRPAASSPRAAVSPAIRRRARGSE